MSEHVTAVTLTDDELLWLDGHVRDKVQKAVDDARARVDARSLYGHLTPILAGFVADVLTEGRSPTIFGNGSYPSTCPSCGAQNSLGRSPVERTGTHTMVEVS
jgi:hypothetical protein